MPGSARIETMPVVPAPTSILGDMITSGTAAPLFTIPAGRTWFGSMAVECSGTTANAQAVILLTGSTVTPAAGNILQADANSAAAGTGNANNNQISNVYISAGTSSATVSGTITGTGSVTAWGILL